MSPLWLVWLRICELFLTTRFFLFSSFFPCLRWGFLSVSTYQTLPWFPMPIRWNCHKLIFKLPVLFPAPRSFLHPTHMAEVLTLLRFSACLDLWALSALMSRGAIFWLHFMILVFWVFSLFYLVILTKVLSILLILKNKFLTFLILFTVFLYFIYSFPNLYYFLCSNYFGFSFLFFF